MHELINKIFESEVSKTPKKFSSPKLNRCYSRNDDLYEKLRKSLSKEEVAMLNEYDDNIPQIVSEEKRRAFLLGLQTGARLMMKILNND